MFGILNLIKQKLCPTSLNGSTGLVRGKFCKAIKLPIFFFSFFFHKIAPAQFSILTSV